MPRGKYVNHKGRSRHFTSPEELAQEHDDDSSEEQSSSAEENDGDAAGASGSGKATRTKPKPRAKKVSASGGGGGGGGGSSDDSDEESSEEEDDRDARKGVASLIEIENPNRATKKTAQKLSTLKLDGGESGAKPELTRREREQIEKQKARARYEKMHAAGKTTEAKADLARLALVRQQRAEAAAKREAEKKVPDDKKSTGNKA